MPKKKSTFNRYTWIITELILGLASFGYGLSGLIMQATETLYIFTILTTLGGIAIVVAIIQILILRKKKVDKFCSKCGEKIKKEDEFCAKCGKELA